MEEFFFYCPCCAQRISMLFDLSVRGQTYIEDCEVCCNPLEITYRVDRQQVTEFDVQAAQ